MANGKEDDEYLVSGIWYLVSGIWYLVSGKIMQNEICKLQFGMK
ncbi:MAG: hypothetical protein WCJ58_09070 [bacterium]